MNLAIIIASIAAIAWAGSQRRRGNRVPTRLVGALLLVGAVLRLLEVI